MGWEGTADLWIRQAIWCGRGHKARCVEVHIVKLGRVCVVKVDGQRIPLCVLVRNRLHRHCAEQRVRLEDQLATHRRRFLVFVMG